MDSSLYDAIVLGGGIIGRYTALKLIKADPELKVLLIDQFSMSESYGSSKGRSKGIQKTHWVNETDTMKQMRMDSLEEWESLQLNVPSKTFMRKHEALFVGPADCSFMKYTLQSLRKYPGFEEIGYTSNAELRERYPNINFSEDCVGILDESELCLAADEILKYILRKHAMEVYWKLEQPDIACPSLFEYKNKSMVWTNYTTEHGPCLKIGFPGKEISHEDLHDVNSLQDENMVDYMTKYIKDTFGNLVSNDGRIRVENCVYTFTKDGKFIIGRHPERNNIVLAVGMIGRGFGYSPAISNIVCDLVLGKQPKYDISEFDVARFE